MQPLSTTAHFFDAWCKIIQKVFQHFQFESATASCQEPTEVEEKEKQRVEALKAVEAHAQEVLTGNTGIYLLGKINFGNSVLYIGIESHGKTSMMPAVSCCVCVCFFRFHSFI